MNIDGDYLWDKTGEPDPETQQLEEILGTLRYQPRPLEIPADLKTDPRPGFFSGLAPRLVPRLAIAATIVIVLLGLGLWLGLQLLQRGQPPAVAPVANVPNTHAPAINPGSTPQRSPNENQNRVVTLPDSDQKHSEAPRRHGVNSPLLAANANRARNGARKAVVKNPELTVNELQEGKAAKDQLMLALRVASAKLNFAQKKMQNTNPRDPVHNQHKIG
jgi:transposase-like protein